MMRGALRSAVSKWFGSRRPENSQKDGPPLDPALKEFFEKNLVIPKTLELLRLEGNDILSTSGRRMHRVENGIPVLLDRSQSVAGQMSELNFAEKYIAAILRNENPHYPASVPFDHPRVNWSWCEPWINSGTVGPETRIVCIGGSFGDDLPHVRSDHKFNVDHLSVEYRRLMPQNVLANTHYLACSSENLPFATGYADLVYIRNAIDHVSNPLVTLGEIHRILKDEGRLFVAAYHHSTFVDEHESTVMDDEFIASCLEPLFTIEHRVVGGVPPQIAAIPTPYEQPVEILHLVTRKRAGGMPHFEGDEVERVGAMLARFHQAMDQAGRRRRRDATQSFRSVLEVEPVLLADVYRRLYALLHWVAAEDGRLFRQLTASLPHLGLGTPFWEGVSAHAARFGRRRVSSPAAPEWEAIATGLARVKAAPRTLLISLAILAARAGRPVEARQVLAATEAGAVDGWTAAQSRLAHRLAPGLL